MTASRLAWATRDRGRRNRAAWWSSTLPAKNWLEMMYELWVMCGSSTVQW
jgi:hypothetical protein